MRSGANVLVLATALSLASNVVAQQNAPTPQARAAAKRQRTAEVELTDDAHLARVVGLYEAGKYADCAAQLAALLPPQAKRPLRDREVIENARIYHAACLIGSGKAEEADEPLRAAIRDNKQMRPPDSLLFPPPVIERFLRVRQSLYQEIRKAEQAKVDEARQKAAARAALQRAEAERVAQLEALASTETILIKNRRSLALVPFGVGQFQNRNDGLGWVFLTSETVLAATALTALGAQSYFTLQAEAPQNRNEENNAVLRTWYTLLKVSSYSLLAVAALGVAEAQLSFVPEFRTERARPLPPSLKRPRASGVRVRPVAVATPAELSLGVRGEF